MKKAFTLAEVLITLVIIGVIAAITIPNLMQSWKKHQVEVGLKEAYSILTNTLNMAKTENGNFDEMIDSANGSVFVFAENYIKPYIKYSEYCTPSQSWSSCKTFNYGRSRLYDIYGHHQDNAIGVFPNWPRFTLQNGMYLGVGYLAIDGFPVFHFVVDINGAKGYNLIGNDIFYFSLFKSGTGSCSTPDNVWCNKGNKILPGQARYEYRCIGTGAYNCASGGVAYCATEIFNNGWKIPDNYPVKKW